MPLPQNKPISYNVPIVTGGLIELLKNPIVAGPSDVIKMWTTNDDYVGVNNAGLMFISTILNLKAPIISANLPAAPRLIALML